MCLAVPGQVMEWIDRSAPLFMAIVEFGGVSRPISLACVPEVNLGDYILAHAGIAISRIDPEEAERVLQTLQELQELEGEIEADRPEWPQ